MMMIIVKKIKKNDKTPDTSYALKKKYIVWNYRNIDSSDIIMKKINGDGNYLFRAISYFLHNTENKYNEVIKRKTIIPNVEIDTEMGKNDKNWGGDLEISISYDLYNYNIAEYKEIYNDHYQITHLEFIQYINSDNNEQKDLLILTSNNDNHFNLAYYKNIVNNTKDNLSIKNNMKIIKILKKIYLKNILIKI